jgi:selenocysteine lyase/cysteine desulfurase
MLRVGLVHYNTAEEIDRLLAAMVRISHDAPSGGL